MCKTGENMMQMLQDESLISKTSLPSEKDNVSSSTSPVRTTNFMVYLAQIKLFEGKSIIVVSFLSTGV